MSPKKRPVDGATKPVSRVVLGSVMMDSNDLPLSFPLLDYFFEFGGNCIRYAATHNCDSVKRRLKSQGTERESRASLALAY
jgi:hypothetical protein